MLIKDQALGTTLILMCRCRRNQEVTLVDFDLFDLLLSVILLTLHHTAQTTLKLVRDIRSRLARHVGEATECNHVFLSPSFISNRKFKQRAVPRV
jgi:hypothetical protein